MKYMQYFESHEDQNMEWCAPYRDKTGEYVFCINEGVVDAIHTPEGDFFTRDAKKKIEDFARQVNPDCDMYEGYSPMHIALDVMREVGCASCPWRHDCDAMDEEIPDDFAECLDSFGNHVPVY